MSDHMTPIPFKDLCCWVREEHRRHGAVFGVDRFYRKEDDKRLPLFGRRLETPLGPAAGPHTQLAQNIVAAYLAGSRFFELKTVQVIDGPELAKCVPKPCITAEDEAYNCEWSTELTVEDAFAEYVKAHVLITLLARQWDLGEPDGFAFNMSVGYDLAGIRTPKIDSFIEGLKDAARTPIFQECIAAALEDIAHWSRWDEEGVRGITPAISSSITLSTLHGCPPAEIERIAAYLIEEKGLHTFVKCNPTLLGYEFARTTMDNMGYGYMSFDDHHFREDLQYEDALPMLRRLQERADARGLAFGVKLSNTLPVDVTACQLPSEQMYMSGRALYPLTVALAARLARDFKGALRISFSGGADAFNICPLFQCGVWPVTVATTLLKPGGYRRCAQLASRLSEHPFEPFRGVNVAALSCLAQKAVEHPRHVKAEKPVPYRKLPAKVPRYNCFTAPCQGGCPIEQDIPEYVELVGKGKNREALRVIIQKNPLPFITGTICPHHCMDQCTRNFYEVPVAIREAKLTAARNAFDLIIGELEPPPKSARVRAAVVGGGPAGLSAAYFLGRAGVAVTLFEKERELGGLVRQVIPRFRINDHAIDQDIRLMEHMGVQVVHEAAPPLQRLRDAGYDAVIYATGAPVHGAAGFPCPGALPANEFLRQYKQDETGPQLGARVVVVGGGNVAMDAARAALRVPGVTSVTIAYRRTRRYMPADEEEWQLAREEGVTMLELLAPKSWDKSALLCARMALGEPDASGRRQPVDTGETLSLPADSLILALGDKADIPFFTAMGVACGNGRVITDAACATNLPGVYVVGDARRGPATVVEAIADASSAAHAIAGPGGAFAFSANAKVTPAQAREKKGVLRLPKRTVGEAARCLNCSTVCENCVDVCPNRANLSIEVPGMKQTQILHVERMCNECGNCTTFCPYDSQPYREKMTLFHTAPEFQASGNEGFLVLDAARRKVRLRLAGQVQDLLLAEEQPGLDPSTRALLETVLERYPYLL